MAMKHGTCQSGIRFMIVFVRCQMRDGVVDSLLVSVRCQMRDSVVDSLLVSVRCQMRDCVGGPQCVGSNLLLLLSTGRPRVTLTIMGFLFSTLIQNHSISVVHGPLLLYWIFIKARR